MLSVPEGERLEALWRLEVLDKPQEDRFDYIVRIAQHLFRVPMVSITLVDAARQWRVSYSGPLTREASLEGSICAVAMRSDEPFLVRDLAADPRFQDNPFVQGDPHLRFYAGFPLHGHGGEPVGSFCVMDVVPRRLSWSEVRDLYDLGTLVQRELTGRTDPGGDDPEPDLGESAPEPAASGEPAGEDAAHGG